VGFHFWLVENVVAIPMATRDARAMDTQEDQNLKANRNLEGDQNLKATQEDQNLKVK